MKEAIIVTLLLIGGVQAVKEDPPNTEPSVQVEQVAEAVIEKIEEEQAKDAPPADVTEPVLTWRDNPNDCNLSTQYVLAEDLSCKDRPLSSPTPRSTGSAGNCESYRSLLSQYSGWNVDTMLYAMRKESGCNPGAVGDNYPINGLHAVSCGLLQVRTVSGRPSCAALKDPATNIAWAHKIYLGQGYRAWTTLH